MIFGRPLHKAITGVASVLLLVGIALAAVEAPPAPWTVEALVTLLRTKNLYPPGMYAGQIADKVAEVYSSKGKASDEIVFDDLEFLARDHEVAPAAAPYEAEPGDIEELLDVGAEDDKFEEGEEIKQIDTTLKIEDDEFADIDDES